MSKRTPNAGELQFNLDGAVTRAEREDREMLVIKNRVTGGHCVNASENFYEHPSAKDYQVVAIVQPNGEVKFP